MRKVLTEKEEEFYNKIIKYYLNHLATPKKNEIARFLGISPQSAQYYFTILKKKGWLDKTIKV